MSNDQKKQKPSPDQQSKSFYRQALDNMPTQLAIMDVHGRYQYLTPSAVSDPEVRAWLIGRDDFDYCELRGLDKSIAQKRQDVIGSVARSGETYQFEETLVRDGRSRHIIRFVSPVFDSSGEVVQVLGYGLDITDSRETESALYASEEQYRTLVEEAFDIIFQTDADGRFTYANPVAYQHLGYSEDEIIGHHFSDLIVETHRNSVVTHYAQQRNEKMASSYLEFPVTTSDGRPLWLGQYVRMSWEGDEFLGISAQARDIDERRLTEQALKESETLKAAIVSTALDCVITIDEHSRIIEFNPAAVETFGFDAEYAIGRDLADLVIPAQLRAAHKAGMEHFLKTGEGPVLGTRIEITAIRSDGSEFPVELAITAIESGTKKLFTAFIRDITSRKEAEDALIEGKALAEQSARAREIFLASMSHEIRTPLNAIVGMLHLLHDTDLSSDQERYLGAAQFSVDSLLGLVDEVLDLTKIEAGVIEPQLRVFSVNDTMSDLVATLRPKTCEKDLVLTLKLADDLPAALRGDPLRTTQIVANLVTNAIKFSNSGEILLEVLLEEIDSEAATLAFVVTDQGRGIPETELDNVFEHFTQVDDSSGAKNPGVGLGLSIVKKLTNILGGEVSVESTLGRGSRFTVRLPFILAELMSDDAPRSVATGIEVEGSRILVVEDNVMNQLLMRELLSKWGAEVTLAENGQVAVELVSKHKYDLVLMDIQMPVMNGYEATRQIRETLGLPSHDLPIVALTASVVIEQRDKALEVGMNAFVSKPFVPAALRKVIEGNLAFSRFERDVSDHDNPPTRIDPAILTEQTLGNTELAVTVIDLFLTQLDESVDQIELAWSQSDLESIRFVAHKLKSSAGSVGAKGLASLLAELEAAADSGNLDYQGDHLEILKREQPLVRSELLTLRAELVSG
jgi:PAS domain S-box-containing protein